MCRYPKIAAQVKARTDKNQCLQPVNAMIRRIQQQNKAALDLKKLWQVVGHLGTIDREMRLRNEECHIPAVPVLPPEKNQHDQMNHCHVIGSKFLGLIRKGSNLLTWQLSPHHVGYLAVQELERQFEDEIRLEAFKKKFERGVWNADFSSIIPDVTRFSPNRARDEDCKYTVACHQHDNSLWKTIDTLRINLNDRETQFLLGYRSVLSSFAWFGGAKLWAKLDLIKDGEVRGTLRKYPVLKPLLSQAQELARRRTNTDDAVEVELSKWTEAYQALAWDRVFTTVHETECRVPMAGTGFWRGHWGKPTIGTIVPSSSVLKDGRHVVLVSQITPTIPLVKAMYEKSLERNGGALARGLSDGNLCETLIELSDWQFLYFRKKEYETEITESDRNELERTIASRKVL